jgi:hypothetical protein
LIPALRVNSGIGLSFCLGLQLPRAILNEFYSLLEVRGDKHPRSTGIDEIEQSSILLGRSIATAVQGHQNSFLLSADEIDSIPN